MEVFCFFYCLRPSFGVEFYQEIGYVGFYSAFRYKKHIGNLFVGKPFRNLDQNFIFPFADAQLLYFLMVDEIDFFFFQRFLIDVDPNDKEDNGNGPDSNFYGDATG